jgi:hypothetical protein
MMVGMTRAERKSVTIKTRETGLASRSGIKKIGVSDGIRTHDIQSHNLAL